VIHIEGLKGKRSIPIESFFVLPAQDVTRETVVEPGEIVTEILLQPPAQDLKSSHRKVRARRSWDFAIAGVALALQLKGDIVRAPVLYRPERPLCPGGQKKPRTS
jgi:xanthine dehydrogenase YagS FAD-binding subunit